jgi:uncharacterized protein YkwD
MLELTNKERAKEKLPPVKPNPVLFKVARAHSANMAKHEMQEHVLDGKTPADRAKEGGYNWEPGFLGENVGHGFDSKREKHTIEQMVDWWMHSRAHREVLMKKEFTEVGFGIVKSKKGDTYYTQLFAMPYKED